MRWWPWAVHALQRALRNPGCKTFENVLKTSGKGKVLVLLQNSSARPGDPGAAVQWLSSPSCPAPRPCPPGWGFAHPASSSSACESRILCSSSYTNSALWEQAEASRRLLKSLFSPVGFETCKTSICCSLQVCYCL